MLTDSVQVVWAVQHMEEADIMIHNVIRDIRQIVLAFEYVLVSKVTCEGCP